jgi:rod shape-determining protein MreC
MGDKKRLGVIALVVSAILSPFIFFSTPLKSWESDNPLLMVWQEIIYPVEYLWHSTTTSTLEGWKSYVDLSNAAQENIDLKTELNLLKTRFSDYDERLKENERLRGLLGFRGRYENKMVAAEVVGINDHVPFQYLRITRGKSDGLDVGMPVVAADGIVGRIVRLGNHFADVQILVDSDFKADALLQRTRVRGVLSGSNRSHCTLQLHKRTEIRIGDTIITSGIVGGFPKGLPIGKVMRISYDSESVAQRITIEPWVDYRRLEEVMVLLSPDQELEKIIETAGSDWLKKTVDRAVGG